MHRHLAALTLALLAIGGAPAALPEGGSWRDAPELLPLFTAVEAHPGAYEAFVTSLTLDDAVRQQQETQPGLVARPGGLRPQALVASEVFGQDGRADRWTIARLFGARRVRVARAARAKNGRVIESWMFVSPFPDASLTHLDSGTLLIVLRVP